MTSRAHRLYSWNFYFYWASGCWYFGLWTVKNDQYMGIVTFFCLRFYYLRYDHCFSSVFYSLWRKLVTFFHRTWAHIFGISCKRSFPSYLVPRFQNEYKCETFHMKMSSEFSFIFMQIKVIFIRTVSQLGNWGTRELRSGLFCGVLKSHIRFL